MIDDRLLTVNEVAQLLRLAPGSVYHLVSQRRLPCVRLSARCLRFRESEIWKYIGRLSSEVRQEK